MTSGKPVRNTGSFRDPTSRVYEVPDQSNNDANFRILRGVDSTTLANQRELKTQKFYQHLVDRGDIVKSTICCADSKDPAVISILEDGWAGVLEHEPIEVVSYPYEWPFSMLKDAALLHLRILKKCLPKGWTLKDATPYNIQWRGSQPVFIDTPSFVPRPTGEHWLGYRQFCMMFFTPLALKAHLDIDHLPILRSCIDGVSPVEANKYFQGINKLKKGVLSHIVFPARVEQRILNKERNRKPAQKRIGQGQSDTVLLALVDSMERLVSKLQISSGQTDWSDYQETHSYTGEEHNQKKQFVEKHLENIKPGLVWDMGCNAGEFSKICQADNRYVVAVDGDQMAIEKLYRHGKANNQQNILSLVLALGNISPDQGWASSERIAFDKRSSPDLVLFLALVHHMRLSANIPVPELLSWLHKLNADIVFEFVNRDDEMVLKLLANKKEQYEDYCLENFESSANALFTIADKQTLKSGKRKIYLLTPK